MYKLKFSLGEDNIKLAKLEKLMRRKLYTFSLPSGVTCPYANECLAKVVHDANGNAKMWYGPEMEHVCYSASLEVIYPAMLRQREHNMEVLKVAAKSWRAAADMILESIPVDAEVIRLHVGGDFKTRPYFRAWCAALSDRPDILGYAYTKSIPFWVLERDAGRVPDNFLLTASYGGKADDWIALHDLRYVRVVHTVKEARVLGLPIDHDDRHASLRKFANTNFALLIHGKQRKGSLAAEAVRALKGKGSYSRSKKAVLV